jgi:hypothetical protein
MCGRPARLDLKTKTGVNKTEFIISVLEPAGMTRNPFRFNGCGEESASAGKTIKTATMDYADFI